MTPLLLASTSAIRRQLLEAAGVAVEAIPAKVDEATILAALEAEGASARDIADTLAEMKARKIAERNPDRLVLGCDQVLEFEGKVWSKPATQADALAQLSTLRGKRHRLLSAAVVYDKAKPVWRHISRADLTMRDASDGYLQAYVTRNWPGIGHCVGAYQLEAEGVRLFSAIEGDYFTILGLPLLPLLDWLGTRGFIDA